MKPMKPEGLKQSPQKPVNHVPQKVNVPEKTPINDSVNLLDAIRLAFRKKFENFAFDQLQVSKGVAIPSAIGGMGMFGWVDWTALATGNWFEIIKLIVSFILLAVGWMGKK